MVYYESNYLCHYGLKGMKWGQRRWQNADGTFNAAGKARYFGANSDHRPDSVKKIQGDSSKNKQGPQNSRSVNDASNKSQRNAKLKKAAKIGATVAAAGLLAYGGYKLYSSNQANKAIKSMISDAEARERRQKGEQALARMYDKMAMEAMRNGATHYSFADNKIGYRIEMGKR